MGQKDESFNVGSEDVAASKAVEELFAFLNVNDEYPNIKKGFWFYN